MGIHTLIEGTQVYDTSAFPISNTYYSFGRWKQKLTQHDQYLYQQATTRKPLLAKMWQTRSDI